MTTIAYRDGIIAADTQETHGDHIKGTCHKIVVLRKNLVYAAACDTRDEQVFKEVLLDGKCAIHDFKKAFEAIVYKDGKMYCSYRNSILVPLSQTYIAIGTGWELAMAGMMRGDTAEEAVRFAATLDIYTSEPVDTYDTRKPAVQKAKKTSVRNKARVV